MSDNIDAQRLQEAMEAFVQTLHNGSSGVETEAKRQARIQAELNETQKRLDENAPNAGLLNEVTVEEV